MGNDFRGVVDVENRMALLFEAGDHGAKVIEAKEVPFDEAEEFVGARNFERASEELELLGEAGDPYDHDAFLRGEISPVFWGSAMTNFGIAPLLSYLAHNAAAPRLRETEGGDEVLPEDERFSGFIFKIQANMNPRHRDRIAFLRVVSGRFERGIQATIGRSGEVLRLSKPHTFMADERSIVEEAYPGDIVGLYDPGKLRVGDTLCAGEQLRYGGIPRFAPEHFVQITLRDAMKRKGLDQGLSQLAHEGVVQIFYRPELGRQDPYLGAVGLLQFEVLKQRLQNEYGVKADYRSTTYRFARWIGGAAEGLKWLKDRRDFMVVEDRNQQPVLLTETSFQLNYALENAPGLELFDIEPL